MEGGVIAKLSSTTAPSELSDPRVAAALLHSGVLARVSAPFPHIAIRIMYPSLATLRNRHCCFLIPLQGDDLCSFEYRARAAGDGVEEGWETAFFPAPPPQANCKASRLGWTFCKCLSEILNPHKSLQAASRPAARQAPYVQEVQARLFFRQQSPPCPLDLTSHPRLLVTVRRSNIRSTSSLQPPGLRIQNPTLPFPHPLTFCVPSLLDLVLRNCEQPLEFLIASPFHQHHAEKLLF
ncbi:hypothetical protein QBC35DRAFT_287555 [Podospora australis]|uniref:Uncharacterized protein n=1 Tax=Podospora australis TaxID=1536484 RepID=A0AAN7AHB9_9PEZI|nr:hypothetical protein QBC35DRAFT_287555 [Podospora australis]